MGADVPSWHAVLSQGRCGMGASALGGPPPKPFYILRLQGCILGNFRPIWLSVLALLRKAFAKI